MYSLLVVSRHKHKHTHAHQQTQLSHRCAALLIECHHLSQLLWLLRGSDKHRENVPPRRLDLSLVENMFSRDNIWCEHNNNQNHYSNHISLRYRTPAANNYKMLSYLEFREPVLYSDSYTPTVYSLYLLTIDSWTRSKRTLWTPVGGVRFGLQSPTTVHSRSIPIGAEEGLRRIPDECVCVFNVCVNSSSCVPLGACVC